MEKTAELIIGPVAWEQAEKVTGLRIDIKSHEINAEAIRSPIRRPPAELAGEKLFGAPTSPSMPDGSQGYAGRSASRETTVGFVLD